MAETTPPSFSFISSALRLVITFHLEILTYADYNMGHNATELKFYDLSFETIPG